MTASEWVLLARIVRPQGRRGEVVAEGFTDFPEQISCRKTFLRGPDGASIREQRVETCWLHKNRIVLKLAGVDTISAAETLRGYEIVVPLADRIPLEGDAVYISDLLGMHVIDTRSGGAYDAGEIVDVDPEGSGPAMLVIRGADGNEMLVPFVRAYLKKVDLQAGNLEMELPDGLLAAQRPD